MTVPTLPKMPQPQSSAPFETVRPSGAPPAQRRSLPERQALENVRRLVERNRRPLGSAPAAAGQVGIVGAGIMGSAIAAVHARNFVPVVLVDTCEDALLRAREVVLAELGREAAGREAFRLAPRLLFPTLRDEGLSDCGLVLESIAENVSAKQRLYRRLEPRLAADAVWASNTSAIPIGLLASALAQPSRFCGLHFFHPVRGRPLVEIAGGPRTSAETIAKVVAHARALGLLPIVVEDGPGFAMNRLLLAYVGEAMALLSDGVDLEEIEQAMVDFGMALSPFEMLDEIGLDTALRTGLMLAEVANDRLSATWLLVRLVKAGQLGCKTGAGFFTYPAKSVNPMVRELIAEHGGASRKPAAGWITTRLVVPMVLEATRLLEEGKVRDPRDIDLGMIFGLGFPACQGGLLWWADRMGPRGIVELLETTEGCGLRAHPTPLLAHLARTRTPFYALAEFQPQIASQSRGIAVF
jgi:3-hydroxyacyl-CoA dehydrogenase/enoyl-CoA hydratase/3-hydroxybutyryl-CoA epimerase/3-hydroxyacyl-CoA dehydrogenase/enoyl-CoA hydratase/3-hydroxybutyryl-CoA epimerase/enoyl-CoA isomerase